MRRGILRTRDEEEFWNEQGRGVDMAIHVGRLDTRDAKIKQDCDESLILQVLILNLPDQILRPAS